MDMEIQELDNCAVFTAKIVPGSSGATRVCGVLDGMLKIKVSAPPEKGKANQCLLKFLARALDINKSALNIVAGKTSPIKRVHVSGVSAEMLRRKLTRDVRGIY
jgi:hypothetical protein